MYIAVLWFFLTFHHLFYADIEPSTYQRQVHTPRVGPAPTYTYTIGHTGRP